MTGIVIAGIGVGSLIWPPIIEQIDSVSDWRIASVVIGLAIFTIAIPAGAVSLSANPSQIGQKALGDIVTSEEEYN